MQQQAKEQEDHALTAAQTQQQAKTQAPRSTTRFINNLPRRYDAATPFHNRNKEQAAISSAIDKGTRVITVHGRAGTGKTGLVSKVLADVENAPDKVDGMVYLTGGGTLKMISLERVINDFKRLLPEGTLEVDANTPTEEKVLRLLNALSSGRYMLLLDNLESLQDRTTHALTDSEITALVTKILEQGGLTILITTQLPLKLNALHKAHELSIPLNEGLPEPEAIEFLRSLSGADKLHADDKPLKTLITRTRGFPRALEAAMGWLNSTAIQTLEDLLADEALFRGEVSAHIVQKAVDALPPVLLRVMEALAVFGQPVMLHAMEYLLAPYLNMQAAPLSSLLNLLVGARFVAFNSLSREFSLHSLDRDYCYNHIPEGTSSDVPKSNSLHQLMLQLGMEPPQETVETLPPYTRYALNHRAAEFFQLQRLPREEWKTIDDLKPQLAEFEYRLRIEDYDTAASLLISFDFDCLLLWGYAARMREMHERLMGKVKNKRLAGICLTNLGIAYRHLGQVERAIGYYEQALAIDREIGDKRGEGADLGSLGIAYRHLGQMERAIGYYEQALKIAQETGNKGGEGADLGNLGIAYYYLGQVEQAIGYFEQALKIAQEIGDKEGESIYVGSLGEALAEIGNFEWAVSHLKEAIKIGDAIRSPSNMIVAGTDLAYVYVIQLDLQAARKAVETARQYETDEYNHNAAALHGVILLLLKEQVKAKTAFDDAGRFASGILAHTPKYYEALYARGLAQAGLALIEDKPLDNAQQDYQAALEICSAAGVVKKQRRLLGWLVECEGGERLQPLYDLLQ